MTDHPPSPRAALVREALVFQLKLLADGLRDFVMVPVSLVAAAVGIMRSETDPDREFRQVLELGRETERMINLFGSHERAANAADLDTLVNHVESLLREQVRRGDVTRNAGESLGKALAGLHQRVTEAPVEREPTAGDEGKR